MIAVIAGAFALVLVIAAWARFAAGRSERQSVATYEHALGVLGGVARRGKAPASVRAPTDDELARPHVEPAEAFPVRPLQRAEVPPPQVRLEPPVPPRPPTSQPASGARTRRPVRDAPAAAADGPAAETETPPPARRRAPSRAAAAPPPEVVVAFDDLDETPPPTRRRAPWRAEATPPPEVVVAFDDLEETPLPTRPPRSVRRLARTPHVARRRAVTGVAAAVALGALGVGGWRLASSSHPDAAPPATPAPSHPAKAARHHAAHHHAATVPAPTTLQPDSVSATLVSYTVPESSYTITFTTTGRCWIGTQHQVSNTSWDWEETVPAAASAADTTQGTVFIEIGAPAQVSTINVNGVPLALPPHRTGAYRVVLTPQAPAAT